MKAADLPLRYNCVDILERNLAARGDKPALFSIERELTFRGVADEVNRVGNALRRLGVREGEYVGLLSLDGPEWVTTFFGIMPRSARSAIGMNTMLKPLRSSSTSCGTRGRGSSWSTRRSPTRSRRSATGSTSSSTSS